MCGGWIKVHRKMVESAIFKKPDYLQVWLYLLLEVNHKDKKIIWNNSEKVVKKGAGIFSIKSISEVLNIPRTTVQRVIETLKNGHQIKVNSTNKFTEIEIVKWEEYQDEEENGHPAGIQRASSGHPAGTNKNDKNVENERIRVDVLPYLDQYGTKMIEDFIRYWIETDRKGTAKWLKEKTWDVKLRLITWHNREEKFERKAKPVQKSNGQGGVIL
jgi:hypothetical protein